MIIRQFIKTLNNTEIGKGGTHECYVLVSRRAKNIENIFDLSNRQPSFTNLKNGGKIESVHITSVREFRIKNIVAEADLLAVFETLKNNHKNDWLLVLELLELAKKHNIKPTESYILKYLEKQKEKQPKIAHLISDGIDIINEQL